MTRIPHGTKEPPIQEADDPADGRQDSEAGKGLGILGATSVTDVTVSMVGDVEIRATPPSGETAILEAWTRAAGQVVITRVLWRGRVLFDGWEMDNAAWVVALTDGAVVGITTSHGTPVEWNLKDAQAKLEETLASADGIRVAIGLMGGRG